MEIPSLFIYLAKVSACFILMFGFYLLLLAKQKRPTLNRLVLILSVVISLVLPALSYTYTIKEVREAPLTIEQPVTLYETISIPIDAQFNDVVVEAKPESNLLPTKPSKASILLYIYIMVSALLAVRLIWHIAKFGIDIKKYGRPESVDGHRIWVSDRWNHTFSFFRLIVFTKDDFNNPNRNMLLEHELVHVKQLHSLDLLLAELFATFCWFNPLVYVYRHSLSEVHEYLADGRVVDKGGDSLVYKQLILDCVSRAAAPRIANTFSAKLLKNRFEMIAKTNQSRSTLRYALLLPVTMVLLVLFSFRVDHKIEYRVVEDKVESQVGLEPLAEADAPNIVQAAEPVAKGSVESQPLSQKQSIVQAIKDTSVLYARLDKLLGEEQQAIVTILQEADTSLLFGTFYLGDNTPFTLMATAFDEPMPAFELIAEDGGVVHKPVSQNLSKTYVQNNYFIKKRGVYKIRLTNYGQLSEVLYRIAMPKGMNEKVDFGLRIMGKTVFLNGKNRKGSATINVLDLKKDSTKLLSDGAQITYSENSVVEGEEKEEQSGNRGRSGKQSITFGKNVGEPNFLQICVNIERGAISKGHHSSIKENSNLSRKEYILWRKENSNLSRIDDDEIDQVLQYLKENITYPASYRPKRKNLDLVEVEFNLSETAVISNVKVVKGISPELDAELVRVVSQMPGWKPEKPRGEPVPVTIKLSFCLPRKK